ncbi:DUF3397 domain-containing protein [Bacillus sp. FJAT-44742]|uniref:DUF3397 domain-containing protein n=1 Tax=Bacillus sp. FJAT-44742 TaxID=2014005 RepID=UPI000C23A6E0|nr:DUF3397 domain-containing protein [Bacillus sp. FJAT-44742]
MGDVLAWVLATVITLPLLGFYLVYIFTVKITKKKGRAVRLAADVSTLFFMAAVYFLAIEIWGRSFLWLMIIIVLSIACFFTFIHWKARADIEIPRLARGIWRFSFMLFFIAYFGLSLYGMSFRITTAIL